MVACNFSCAYMYIYYIMILPGEDYVKNRHTWVNIDVIATCYITVMHYYRHLTVSRIHYHKGKEGGRAYIYLGNLTLYSL